MASQLNTTFEPLGPRTLSSGNAATERSEGGGFRRESAALLGTNAKSENKTRIDPETGEILGLIDPMQNRANRFILQQVARKFLPKTRTNNCLRLRQKGKQVEVWKSHEFKTAAFVGLQTCGSVWVCPVCAGKIAERRRAEIVAAMAAHKAAGGSVTLLTLTAPHQRTDNLADLLAKLKKALNSFKNDRHVKAIFKAMGIIGDIKALEVTHGRLSPSNNGWHPHYHILQFGGLGVDYVPLDWLQIFDQEDVLYQRWAAACVRAGLGEPSRAHGLKLDDGSKAAKYVSKWGLEDEMTKGHTKKALHGETPFDFLRSYLSDSNDKQAGALFREFAEIFKGKRQLVWSRGLKKRYAIGELTDEELSAQTDDQARLLGQITLTQWCDVLAVEGRGVVLQLAASGGWDAVAVYLVSIKRNPE
jgi:hypothetical protein